MKALTIKQPWAHLILSEGKDIENPDLLGMLAQSTFLRVQKLQRKRGKL